MTDNAVHPDTHPPVFRVLVTGSRQWPNDLAVTAALSSLYAVFGPALVIVHGACRNGVDAVADAWCRQVGVAVQRFPADWHRYGDRAGLIRNKAMVATRPDLCLAFIHHHSPGASHCARTAEDAGVTTALFTSGGPR